MKYKLTTAVWRDGSGWQPHDIANQYADDLNEAKEIAQQIVDDGAQLGTPEVTIWKGKRKIMTV